MVGTPILLEGTVTSGDYLDAFCDGTMQAIASKRRGVIRLLVDEVSAFSVGMLIALFERAVGIYANMLEINAYHQPGVEAGKKAAKEIIEVQQTILEFLQRNRGKAFRAHDLQMHVATAVPAEKLLGICRNWAANPCKGVQELPNRCLSGEARFRLF